MNQISVFDSPKPAFTVEEAQRLLARDYGVEGTLKELVSERDQNFLVDAPSGEFVLKIANAVEDQGFLALQNAVMKHVALTDPELGLQRVIATAAGEDITTWENGTSRHAVRLLTYLPGELYSAAGSSSVLLESLGTFMGRLSRALRGFGHPAAFRPGFLWNLDEAMAVKPWLADIVAERRDLVARIFARYREPRAAPPWHAARRGACTRTPTTTTSWLTCHDGTVTGLIDFGDMVHRPAGERTRRHAGLCAARR